MKELWFLKEKRQKMENKKTIKELENVTNERIAESITKYRERNHEAKKAGFYWSSGYISAGYESVIFSPLGGYKLKALKNNKPLTLLAAKQSAGGSFVCFANISSFNDNSDNIKFFDITEDKKTVSAGGVVPCCFGCVWHDARKDDGRIFLLLNKNVNNYKIAYKKHLDRAQKWETFTNWERWNANDPRHVEMFDRLNYCVNNSWHRLKIEELDKSGYYLPQHRADLNARLKDLKNKRENERREKSKAQFIASDKSEFFKNIDSLIAKNKNIIEKFLNYESFMKKGALYLLEELRNNIKTLEKLKNNINDYARYNDPEKELNNKILEIKENYIITLTKYNSYDLDWCNNGCYKINGEEVVARYDWIGKPGTLHAGEVVRHPITLNI